MAFNGWFTFLTLVIVLSFEFLISDSPPISLNYINIPPPLHLKDKQLSEGNYTGPKSCFCTDGDGCNKTVGKCQPDSSDTTKINVCFSRCTRHFLNSAFSLTKGCDAVEKTDYFQNRRVIYVYRGGLITASEECMKTDCNTLKTASLHMHEVLEKFQKSRFGDAFNHIDQKMNETFNCECTGKGMQLAYHQSCVAHSCSRKSQKTVENSFYCVNWGNHQSGCYTWESMKGDLYLADILIEYEKGKPKRYIFCKGNNCQYTISATQFVPDIDGYDATDELLSTTEKPGPSDLVLPNKTAKKSSASSVLGAVGAVVVIFITVIVSIFVIINFVRIIKIEINVSSGKRPLHRYRRSEDILDLVAV